MKVDGRIIVGVGRIMKMDGQIIVGVGRIMG